MITFISPLDQSALSLSTILKNEIIFSVVRRNVEIHSYLNYNIKKPCKGLRVPLNVFGFVLSLLIWFNFRCQWKYFVDNDYMEREKLFCVSSKIRFFLQKGNEIGKKARSEFFDKVATIRHQNGKILPATISHENKNSRLTYNMKYE